jgi:hypothetical protein
MPAPQFSFARRAQSILSRIDPDRHRRKRLSVTLLGRFMRECKREYACGCWEKCERSSYAIMTKASGCVLSISKTLPRCATAICVTTPTHGKTLIEALLRAPRA